MGKKHFIAVSISIVALAFSGCKTLQTTEVQAEEKPVAEVVNVTANPEFISIEEAIGLLDSLETPAGMVKKYGYKVADGYEIYNFDKFSKLFYKNCRLAKVVKGNKYEDYPKPLRRGISSYVAFKDKIIIIGVFNQKAYNNLVAQVKAAGFILDMPGNEDIYKKGTHTIGCLESAKIIRVQ